MTKAKSIYQFFENVFSLFSVKSIDLAIAIWLIPYLIFKVGIVNYGLYAFALSTVLFIVNFTNFGFDLSAVRALAKEANDTKMVNKLFNEVFSVKLYLTGFFLVVFFLLILIVPAFSSYKLLFGFATFLVLGDLFSLRWFFLGVEKMKYIPTINLVAALIYVVLVLLFIKHPKDYTYIILFEGIGVLVAGIISFLYVLTAYKMKIQLLSFVAVGKYLYHNFSSFVNLLIPSVLSNSAVFFVGLFSIPSHVSIIQLSVKFSNAFSTINAILTKVFYPIVNRSKQLMKLSFLVLMSIGLFLSIAMFLSADIFIEPWLKIDNLELEQQVIFCIKLLSPTPLLMAIMSAYGVNGLLIYGKDKLVGLITLVSTIIGLIVGFILIPKYSYIGGVIFLLTIRGLYALVSMLFFKKNKLKIN